MQIPEGFQATPHVCVPEAKRWTSKRGPACLPSPTGERLGGGGEAAHALTQLSPSPVSWQQDYSSLGLGTAEVAMDQPDKAVTSTPVREDLGHGGSVVTAAVVPFPSDAPNYRSPSPLSSAKMPPLVPGLCTPPVLSSPSVLTTL